MFLVVFFGFVFWAAWPGAWRRMRSKDYFKPDGDDE